MPSHERYFLALFVLSLVRQTHAHMLIISSSRVHKALVNIRNTELLHRGEIKKFTEFPKLRR